MARRRKNEESGLEALFGLAKLMPWQVSVGVALALYGGLHWYATSTPPVLDLKNPADTLPFMLGNVGRQVAGVAKYALPAVILAGAAASFFRRKRQAQLHYQVASDPLPDALEKMSWAEFENLTAEAFRKKGYRVIERGGEGPDGGVDLVLYLGKDKYLVQCKQWKTRQVGVAIVRELYGVMAAEGAVGGFVVASGSFTADAEDFAEGRSIKLVDARKLRKLIGGEQATKPPVAASPGASPSCPVCSGRLIERTVKKGPNAGIKFWGCAQFPKCRGVRS